MNAVSEDIKDLLVADSSLGFIFGTDLFIGKEPSKPNDCVTIYDISGYPPAMSLTNENYFYPSLQIRVRNTHYPAAWVQILAIRDLLHGLSQQTINGTLYSVIYCSSGPALMDWDENGRCHLVINFNLQRR